MRVWCLLPTSWEIYFSRIELDPTKFIPAWYSFNKTRLFDWLKIRENNENHKLWTYIISQLYFKELKREYMDNDLIQKLGLESGCHKFGPQVFWRWQNNPNATRHFWNGHSSCRSKKNISSPNQDKNDEMCPRNPRWAYRQNLN